MTVTPTRSRWPVTLTLAIGMAVATPAFAQQAQNPSPMSDTTWPHPRVAEARAAGERATLSTGEFFVPAAAVARKRANALVASPGLTRRPVLKAAPLGMEQVSEARRGDFQVLGFSGNTAPDHVDHLYALGECCVAGRSCGRAAASSRM